MCSASETDLHTIESVNPQRLPKLRDKRFVFSTNLLVGFSPDYACRLIIYQTADQTDVQLKPSPDEDSSMSPMVEVAQRLRGGPHVEGPPELANRTETRRSGCFGQGGPTLEVALRHIHAGPSELI